MGLLVALWRVCAPVGLLAWPRSPRPRSGIPSQVGAWEGGIPDLAADVANSCRDRQCRPAAGYERGRGDRSAGTSPTYRMAIRRTFTRALHHVSSLGWVSEVIGRAYRSDLYFCPSVLYTASRCVYSGYGPNCSRLGDQVSEGSAMATTIYEQGPPDPAVWDEPEMREALAVRDMAAVFRLLKAHGVSQRRIAALTGQSQPEISDILRGRIVTSYDLLSRIARGLGIPRGHMGLAYGPGVDPEEQGGLASSGGDVASWSGGESGAGGSDVHRRAFITRVAQIAITGISAAELSRILSQPAAAGAATVPTVGRIGVGEAQALEAAVLHLRSRDDLLGGGAVVPSAAGEIQWARSLLGASASEQVGQRIQLAAADLHSAAGWAAFDTGDHDQARSWLATGLALAKDAGAHDLAAKVLFQLGRIYLHESDADGALKMFQLGQLAAQDSGVPRAVALMHLSSAWATAELGKADHAIGLLARAGDELARDPGPEHAPSWLGFMGPEEIDGISGMVCTALSARDRVYADQALVFATRSYEARSASDARSRASDQIAIAANQLRAGNPDAGVKAARLVLPQVAELHSARLTDRLSWIAQAATLYPKHSGARELLVSLAPNSVV